MWEEFDFFNINQQFFGKYDVFLEVKLGDAIIEKQQLSLLSGKKVHAKDFKSKAGKSFEADLFLDKSSGRLSFDFTKK